MHQGCLGKAFCVRIKARNYLRPVDRRKTPAASLHLLGFFLKAIVLPQRYGFDRIVMETIKTDNSDYVEMFRNISDIWKSP